MNRSLQLPSRLRGSWFHYWQVVWIAGAVIGAALLAFWYEWPVEALEAPFFAWFICYLIVVDLFAPRGLQPGRWRVARWVITVGLIIAMGFVVRYVYLLIG